MAKEKNKVISQKTIEVILMTENIQILKGNLIFTKTAEEFTELKESYIVVENGKIIEVGKELNKKYKDSHILDYGDNLIIPGFIDMHVHASQFSNRGLGLDEELLPWLDTYTFPEESKFEEEEYAKKVYSRFVKELWKYGTTRSVIFATIHNESTNILMKLLDDAGLGAFVGKVNMDRNSPEFLIEDTEESLRDTEKWLNQHRDVDSIVKPIITPRFVPSCTGKLMEGLGDLAERYDVPVQSHLSENIGEIDWVKELHPDSKDYASVYKEYKLLGQQPTIMAHCVHNTDDEIKLMAENNVFVAHSPISNLNLSSGIAPIRKFLDAGVNVGLASDVSGGHSISMMDVISSTIQSSKMRWLYLDKEHEPLTVSEAFYLSTKGPGKFFGNVGSFEVGNDFDALVIDDNNIKDINSRSLTERLQRFLHIGDDRNIIDRYVVGKKLEEPKIY